MIYKNAFQSQKSKIIILKGNKINKDGCNCTKGCLSKYCGCRKINGKCSPICRCVTCGNDKINMDKRSIQKIYKPAFRKKFKIIVDFNKSMVKVKNLRSADL